MTVGKLKAAKRLVSKYLESKGVSLTHSEQLELIARAHRYANWNTAEGMLSAAAEVAPVVGAGVVPDWLQLPNGIEYVITYEFDGLSDSMLLGWEVRLSVLREELDIPDGVRVLWCREGSRVVQRWENLGSGANILTLLLMQHAYLSEQVGLTLKSTVFDRISRSRETWDPLKQGMPIRGGR